MGLLADPTVAGTLAACAGQDRTSKELEALTGAKPAGLKHKVDLLEAYGLLQRGPIHQRKGRPAASWRAASSAELAAFERHATAFAKALARATERMVDEPAGVVRLRLADEAS